MMVTLDVPRGEKPVSEMVYNLRATPCAIDCAGDAGSGAERMRSRCGWGLTAFGISGALNFCAKRRML